MERILKLLLVLGLQLPAFWLLSLQMAVLGFGIDKLDLHWVLNGVFTLGVLILYDLGNKLKEDTDI
jgi:hypothetical protein